MYMHGMQIKQQVSLLRRGVRKAGDSQFFPTNVIFLHKH